MLEQGNKIEEENYAMNFEDKNLKIPTIMLANPLSIEVGYESKKELDRSDVPLFGDQLVLGNSKFLADEPTKLNISQTPAILIK